MARPTKHEQRYKNVGRKTKITPDVLRKLEEAAVWDATVEEMCFWASISHTTYYSYCKDNPEFLERIAELRQNPILVARQTVVNSLQDPNHAFRYLERKRANEFAPSSKIQHSGSIGTEDTNENKEADAVKDKYEKELRDTIINSHAPVQP